MKQNLYKKLLTFEEWLDQNDTNYYPEADENERERLRELYKKDMEVNGKLIYLKKDIQIQILSYLKNLKIIFDEYDSDSKGDYHDKLEKLIKELEL